MLAFGLLTAQPPLASASRCGMLLFVLALARLRRRPGVRGKFTRFAQPFIPADCLRRPLNSHVGPRFDRDSHFVHFIQLQGIRPCWLPG